MGCWLKVLNQCQATLEIFLQGRVVERGDDALVAFNQCVRIHLGHKIERRSAGSDGDLQKTVFCLEAVIHVRSFQRGQQVDRRHGDAGFLNKIDLGIEHILVVTVQAQDESPLNLHSLLLDFAHRVEEEIIVSPADILRFLGFDQGFGVGGFDAQEYGVETGLDHRIHQRAHSSQI